MKIVHVCVGGPYTDGWNYQENMLTKYQAKAGHDVSLIVSQWAWDNNGTVINVKKTNYVNEVGVKVIRLPIKGDKDVFYRYKRFVRFYETLEMEAPDLIFVHNLQFFDVDQIVKYAKNYKVRIVADNHADYSNSARNFVAKIFYRVVWRHYAKMLEPYVEKFYGVLPSRVTFLRTEYALPKEKCELLVMGADNEFVAQNMDPQVKAEVRKKYGIRDEDFLIVTGGKIDVYKTQTILLMQAVQQMKNKNVKLIIFGSVASELQLQVEALTDGIRVQNIGWLSSEQSYRYFAAADLVVFPGRHSVFWEQVAGMGIPMVCKRWEGTTHIDIGGNVKFLEQDSAEEIQSVLEELTANGTMYQEMLLAARSKGKEQFLYKEIAARAMQ